MILAYVINFDLKIEFINIKILKIHSFTPKIFKIILIGFQINNKLEKF